MSTTVAKVFLVMRMSNHFVAFMVLMFGKEFLEKDESRCEQGSLGEEETLDCGESDDSQKQGNEGLDLQLKESVDWDQLLQLLLLTTA